MDIHAATQSYETWLAAHVPIYTPDLDYKHRQMADANDAFPFFRGTYYRWARHWHKQADELAEAPAVIAVGDLHVENFGTWRDCDGRLCWGINDFDEADRLPYTQDLVRLAASVRFAKRTAGFDLKLAAACASLLKGYRDTLGAGGRPFVLEERHAELRSLAYGKDRDPLAFWQKLTIHLVDKPAPISDAARDALIADLPFPDLEPQFRVRPRVGMGSLGKPRFVALADCKGGWVAREAKALVPPATAWLDSAPEAPPTCIGELVAKAVRSPDPFYRIVPGWVVRRLGPKSSRLELPHLAQARDMLIVLEAMGSETANVHLATPGSSAAILDDLRRRKDGWLEDSARAFAKLMERDWEEWRAPAAK